MASAPPSAYGDEPTPTGITEDNAPADTPKP